MPPSLGGSGHYPVPRRQRYYATLRLPHSHQSSLRFHLARIYHACRHCSDGLPLLVERSASLHDQGFTAPQPVGTLNPVIARGGMRASQVPGSSSSSRAAVNHPAWLFLPSPSPNGQADSVFRDPKALGRHRIRLFRGYLLCGSDVRVSTHRRCRCLHRRKTRYRPAGFSFSRCGFRTHWTTNRVC